MNEVEQRNAEAIRDNVAPDCRECKGELELVASKRDIYFWHCQKCDAMVLESQHEFSLLYLTPDESWT